MAGKFLGHLAPLAPLRLLAALALLALLPSSLAVTSVSILEELNGVHSCVTYCLYGFYLYSDMGSAMQCDSPYDNACYCATGTVQASRAVSWVTACASKSCAAGDLVRDISAMQTAYAGYCSAAGFLQPIITDWLAAAEPSETPSSGDGSDGSDPAPSPGSVPPGLPDQTTRVTVVTRTADPDSGVSASGTGSGSLDVVEATSTRWVDSNGNVVAAPSSSDSGSGSSAPVGLIAGLVAGIGVLLIALGGLVLFCCLRRRNRVASLPPPPPTTFQAHDSGYHQPEMDGVPALMSPHPPPPPSISPPTTTSTTPVSVTPLARKPVPIAETTANVVVPVSPTASNAELSGQHVTREADGTEIHVFPVITPKSPVQVPGTHEIASEGGDRRVPPPRGGGVEMATEGHAPATTFEMPVQGHQRPRGVEMAIEGHEPVTTFEMGGAQPTTPASPKPQLAQKRYQGGGFFREGGQAWELASR